MSILGVFVCSVCIRLIFIPAVYLHRNGDAVRKFADRISDGRGRLHFRFFPKRKTESCTS